MHFQDPVLYKELTNPEVNYALDVLTNTFSRYFRESLETMNGKDVVRGEHAATRFENLQALFHIIKNRDDLFNITDANSVHRLAEDFLKNPDYGFFVRMAAAELTARCSQTTILILADHIVQTIFAFNQAPTTPIIGQSTSREMSNLLAANIWLIGLLLTPFVSLLDIE